MAVNSKLGLLSGPLQLSNRNQEKTDPFHVSADPSSTEQIIEKFWNIESTGTLQASPQQDNQFTDD